jgi:hypothetical protein
MRTKKMLNGGRWSEKVSSKECFTYLDKLNLQVVIDLKLKPIFASAPTGSKNETCFKSDQI